MQEESRTGVRVSQEQEGPAGAGGVDQESGERQPYADRPDISVKQLAPRYSRSSVLLRDRCGGTRSRVRGKWSARGRRWQAVKRRHVVPHLTIVSADWCKSVWHSMCGPASAAVPATSASAGKQIESKDVKMCCEEKGRQAELASSFKWKLN